MLELSFVHTCEMKWEKAQEGLKACPFVVLVPKAWGSNDDGHQCCWLMFSCIHYTILQVWKLP